MALGSIIGGIVEMVQADEAKKELAAQPTPKYSVSPELRGLYNEQLALSETGFTQEEDIEFKKQQSALSGQRIQAGRQVAGGGMQSAIRAGAKMGEIESSRAFEGQRQRLKRQARGRTQTLASKIQVIKNIQSESDISRRLELEQAIGAAHSAGMENVMSGTDKMGENVASFFTGGGGMGG